MFIAEVLRLLSIKNSTIMELMKPFSYYILGFKKNFECLFNTVLGKDGIICDDIGCWSGFNKCGNSIDNVYIGFLTLCR